MLQSGGNGGAKFNWNSIDPNCADDPNATTDPNRPMFSASCYAAGPTNAEDIANYTLSSWNPASVGRSAQTNLQGSASYGLSYHAGDRFGTLEVGGKVRNAAKYNDAYNTTYTVNKGVTIPVSQFGGGFADPHYYDGAYAWPSSNVDVTRVQAYVFAHPEQFTVTGGPGPNKSQFNLTERVTAGYAMNTIDLSSRARLVAGARVESTHVDHDQLQQQHGAEGLQGRRQLHRRAAERGVEDRDVGEHEHPIGLQPRARASRPAEPRSGRRRRRHHTESTDGEPGQSRSEA
jgi:hypothetical protein